METINVILSIIIFLLVLMLILSILQKNRFTVTRAQDIDNIAIGLGTSEGEAQRVLRVANHEMAEEEGIAKYENFEHRMVQLGVIDNPSGFDPTFLSQDETLYPYDNVKVNNWELPQLASKKILSY